MLHSVLSITFVKILLSYCYSSHIERRIDVWQLAVVHLATNFSFDTTVITQKLIKMRSPNSKTTGNLKLLQVTIEQRLEEQYSY